jgi:hypothetical protein
MHKLDFLIIGAQKSGTQSLRGFLQGQEEYFYLPDKELHFWNKENLYQDGEGVEGYLENFKNSLPTQLVGEKSPSYLPSVEAPGRIAKHFPDIKLIAILRNPVDRAYSAFWHGKRVGAISSETTFGQSIRNYEKNRSIAYGDVVSRGFYSTQIQRYLDNFPQSQLHIMDFASTIARPEIELGEMFNFLLGESANSLSDMTFNFPRRNVAKRSRFPKFSERIHRTNLINYKLKSRILRKNLVEMVIPEMDPADRDYLRSLYENEQVYLNKNFGKNFSW